MANKIRMDGIDILKLVTYGLRQNNPESAINLMSDFLRQPIAADFLDAVIAAYEKDKTDG